MVNGNFLYGESVFTCFLKLIIIFKIHKYSIMALKRGATAVWNGTGLEKSGKLMSTSA